MTTLSGAAFVGIAATAMFAAPASAHSSKPAFKAECDTATGKAKVTLTVDNDWNTEATISKVTTSLPLKKIVDNAKIPARVGEKNGTISETLLVELGATVKLSYEADWADETHRTTDEEYKAEVKNCKPPTNGGGGGGTTPTPTPTASTPAAAPTLPVTGSQTGLYAGGAVVLLGAGAGLFMVARRRRLNFEA
jgi:LPXTG-motif cell wall-anchored protein